MRLPRVDATTAPTGTGLVRADPRAQTDVGDAQFRGLQALGAGLQSAGGSLAKIAAQKKAEAEKAIKDRQALDDQISATAADLKAQDAIKLQLDAVAQYDIKAKQPLPDDPKNYYSGDKLNPFDLAARVEFENDLIIDLLEKISSLSGGIKDPKTNVLWQTATAKVGITAIKKALNAKHQEHQESTILGYAENAAKAGDLEASEEFIVIAEKHGLIGPKRAAKVRTDLAELAVKSEVKSLYLVGEYQAARNVATESGLGITEIESLLNTINLIEERNEKKTKDLNFKKDMAVNDDFMTKVATGDLFPDEIKESRLPEKVAGGIFATGKLSQTEWLNYAKASYQDPPTVTVPDGYSAANDIVLAVGSKEMSREEAYRKLLDARYIRKQMTDDDFIWAANRITDPYEKSFAADLSAVVADNNKTLRGLGFFDKRKFSDKEKAKAMNVNRGLMGWVEARLEDDKPPTRVEMLDQSAHLIASDGENIETTHSPKTQKEYDKLPSGAKYLDPTTGRVYRKK